MHSTAQQRTRLDHKASYFSSQFPRNYLLENTKPPPHEPNAQAPFYSSRLRKQHFFLHRRPPHGVRLSNMPLDFNKGGKKRMVRLV
jgi:hypothetical protein